MSEQGYNWRALQKLLMLGLLTVLSVALGLFEAVDIVFLAVVELNVIVLFALVVYILNRSWWFLRLLSLPVAIAGAAILSLMGWSTGIILFVQRSEWEAGTQAFSIDDDGMTAFFELVSPATKVLAVVVVAGMVIQFVMALRFGVEERLSDRVGGIFLQLGVRFAAFFFTMWLMDGLLRTATWRNFDVVLVAAFAMARVLAEVLIQGYERQHRPSRTGWRTAHKALSATERNQNQHT